MLPALIGLVVILYFIGYIGGKLIEYRTLRIEAETVVETVGNYIESRIGPGLTFRAADGDTTNLQSIRYPGAEPLIADLRSVLVLDPDANVAIPADKPVRRPFGFGSSGERAAFERAVRTGTPQYVRTDGLDDDQFRTVFFSPLRSGGTSAGAIRIDVDQSRDARLIAEVMTSRRILVFALGFVGLAVTMFVFWRSIKNRWLAEEEIRFLAMHDVLTMLPNRAQFRLRLERALVRAARDGSTLAVICIDVDNFKDINDTLGHPVGDRILKSTAERILAASGPTSSVARLSGDEFAVLVEHVRSDTDLRKAAQRILRNASIVNEIDGHELVCSISLGVTVAPADGKDADTLMKNADLALYRAKADGRNTMRFFTEEMDRELRRRRLMEEELRRDLGTDRFQVFYQPQFDLRTGRLIGHEALIRWTNPTLGVVSPDAFVRAAEACGLIAPLSEWTLLTACQNAMTWREPVKLAVNLSAAQFRAGDVADMIERVLRWTGMPPERLEIEITETVLLKNTKIALSALTRLRGLGVSVALDDFGTGYSSLSYLSRFPIDKIKIDRSFVRQLTEDRNTTAIVQAIIRLGEALRLEIIAEGVETREQVARLRTIGCHQVQGYLFGAPKANVDMPLPAVLLQQDSLRQATAGSR